MFVFVFLKTEGKQFDHLQILFRDYKGQNLVSSNYHIPVGIQGVISLPVISWFICPVKLPHTAQ